ncbi:hypothetical protein ABIB40_003666 [Pedobacter sp. UYP30]
MKITTLIFAFFCFSCSVNNVRSFTEGNVYDRLDKAPVDNASVYIWGGYCSGFIEITKTDAKG